MNALEANDVLQHLDQLRKSLETRGDLFQRTSECAAFIERIGLLRSLVEKSGHRPTAAQIAESLFPRLAGESLRTTFSSFRSELARVSEACGRRLVLIQPKTRNRRPQEVVCHFEGDSLVDFRLQRMIARSTESLDRAGVYQPQQAMPDTIHVFVSFAVAEVDLVSEFLEALRRILPLRAPGRSFRFWRFDEITADGGIVPGEENEAEIRKAMGRCQLGLLFVSPTYLSRKFIQEVEMPHFLGESAKAHPFPIALQDFEPGKDQNRLLNPIHVFALKGKSFRSLPKTEKGRTAFLRAVAERLAAWVDRNPVPEKVQPSMEDPGERAELRLQKLAAKSGDLPDYCYIRTGAQRTRFGSEDSERKEEANDSTPQTPQERFSGVDVLETLIAWAKDDSSPAYLALLGETGSGKTTNSQELARRLTHDTESGVAAVYLDLRRVNEDGLLRRNPNPLLHEVLASVLRRSPGGQDSTPEDVLRIVRDRGALVIWDGLDEVLVHLDQAQGAAFFRQLTEVLPTSELRGEGEGHVLFACRTQYFRSVVEEASWFGQDQRGPIDPREEHVDAASKKSRRARFEVLRLLPFTEEQIREYLAANVHDLDVARAWEVIEQVHNLRDLAERPYCLSILRHTLKRLDRELGSGRKVQAVDLYARLLDEWLLRDQSKARVSANHKLRLMRRLAVELWRRGAKSMSARDLETWFEETIVRDPVMERSYGRHLEPGTRDSLLEDLRTATLVARWDGDSFRFAHTSIQEYFVAVHLVECLRNPEPDGWNLPTPSDETFDFFAQLLEADPQSRALRAALGRVLGHPPVTAALNAFRYWVRAVREGWPELDAGAVRLPGADLTGWEITGRDEAHPFPLERADLSGIDLSQARLRWVDLDGARLVGAAARQAVFDTVTARGADFDGADLRALSMRCGSVANARGSRARLEGSIWTGVDRSHSELPCEAHDTWIAEDLVSRVGTLVPDSVLLQTGHSNWVLACAFSPDGRLILSGSVDNSLRLWDAASGKLIRSLEGHSNGVMACAFSPDGRLILSGSADNSLRLWDAASGKLIRSLEGHSKVVWACAFSPDGRLILSGSDDNSLRLWDAASGKLIRSLKGHSNGVMACAFSPDGRLILSGSADNSLRLWDAASGKLIRSLKGHSNGVRACAFSPDGRLILSGSADNSLRLWDAASGKLIRSLEGHFNWVMACAFSPDGRTLLSGSLDNSLRLWDAASGKLIRSLEGHSNGVLACAFSPDGRLILSSSDDNSLRLWDAASGKLIRSLEGHSSWVMACAFSPDGRTLLSGSLDNSLRLWDAASGKQNRAHFHLPRGEQATLDGEGQILGCSPGAWEYLTRVVTDPKSGRLVALPAEAFGPLPVE
jgi:WD40 repeat protein/energy-coupling factor transporter ATP-binding protein EcfA2